MSGIFISYRRADKEVTAPLKDALAMHFGENQVWWDADDLGAGTDWLKQIRKAILAADAMLVVIGPNWLQGKRLHEPRSVLRQEIEAALRSPVTVIPVLVGDGRLPARDDLPDSIRDLRSRQKVVLGSDEVAAGASLKRLLADLGELLGPRSAESKVPLPTLHRQMYQMQSRFFEVLDDDPETALELTVNGLRFLDQQLPLHPDDTLLKLFRGYWLKNRAIVHRRAGRHDEAEQDLGQAQRFFFRLVRDGELATASGYNGIGSVEIMRGRYRESLDWIDRALALVPSYEAAQRDRKTAVEQLEKQAARHAPAPEG